MPVLAKRIAQKPFPICISIQKASPTDRPLFQQLPYPPISVFGGSGSIPFKWVDCSGICGSRNANPGGGKGDVRIVRLSCTETVRLELEIIQKGQTVIGFTDAPLIRPGRAEPEICRSLHDTA